MSTWIRAARAVTANGRAPDPAVLQRLAAGGFGAAVGAAVLPVEAVPIALALSPALAAATPPRVVQPLLTVGVQGMLLGPAVAPEMIPLAGLGTLVGASAAAELRARRAVSGAPIGLMWASTALTAVDSHAAIAVGCAGFVGWMAQSRCPTQTALALINLFARLCLLG